jgi:hypothetical protein
MASVSNTITITNDTTDEAITIDRVWAKTDVLEIDVANKTVKVNSVEVDYSGSFPYFAPGSHNLIISSDFSAYKFTVTVDYYKRFL